MESVKSKSLFTPHWKIWKFLGIYNDFTTLRYPYMAYSLLVNVGVTICFPAHLLLSIYTNELEGNFIRTIAVGFGTLQCSMKLLVFAVKLHKLHEMEMLLDLLDERISTAEERLWLQQVCRSANRILHAFTFICTMLALFTGLSILLKTDRSLFQPAWLPFDWTASELAYNVANAYQFTGICYHILQNFANDTFPGMALCLLAGHINLLGMRVSRIGYDDADLKRNEQKLQDCVLDQKSIYRLLEIVEDLISLTMFLQFALNVFNVCMVLAALMFYAKGMFDRMFYLAYLIAQQLEVFPTCYYGSNIEILLGKLHYDIYFSNWMDQSRTYKKNMILFTERSLKRTTVLASGDVPIHLDTFFRTLRATYSLFAVIIKTKG